MYTFIHIWELFPTSPVCIIPSLSAFPTCYRKMSFCNRSLCTILFGGKKYDRFFHTSIQICCLYTETIIQIEQKFEKVFDK